MSTLNHGLILTTEARPLLTLAAKQKWYHFALLHQDPHEASQVAFGELEDYCDTGESPFLDHVPNPAVVRKMCEKRGWHFDPLAWEALCGRWAAEYYEFSWTTPPELED